MPKPLAGQNGSGMHVHQSLFQGEHNAFFDVNAEYHLSDTCKHFIAGLLKYVPEFTAVTNQWVNSFKRLVPGFEAPVYISWAQRNRSNLIRIPMYKPGKEGATRIEFRSPDPACNPYLAFSVMLAAGLRGIEDKLECPPPTEVDLYHLTQEQRDDLGIKSLPGSLIEAITLCEGSELVRDALGDHVFREFIANKRLEWDRYRTHVTDYEITEYLPLL
jgi:glutamine synthetase